MKIVQVNQDKSLEFADAPVPEVLDDECLIKVFACGINRADIFQREGKYPSPQDCPDWMGLEISGEIVKMGKIAEKESDLFIGEKVCALLGGGGYAEYVSAKFDLIMPVPSDYTMTEAACIPEAFATSYLNLFMVGNLKAGDSLFVTGGSSGLASVMIPMAKAFGIRVITSVRKKTKAEKIKHLGADLIINTENENIAELLKNELKSGNGIDVAVDCVGGEMMGKCFKYMKNGGRWIVISALAGRFSEIDLNTLFGKNTQVIGSTLRSKPRKVKAEIISKIKENIFCENSKIKIHPTIYKEVSFSDVESAHRILYNGENIGKVVLVI